MGKRCIVTSSDANYFPGVLALLTSLARTNPGIPRIVFDGGLEAGQRKILRGLADLARKEPFCLLENRGKFGYIGNTTLLKFEAAELDHEKVLCLDADMVVLEDIGGLFDVPEGKVGVVPEVNALKNMFRPKDRGILRDNIDIDWEGPGFNAGLFMLRPSEWRTLKPQAMELIRRFGPEVFSKTKDQQLLNIIFRGKTHVFERRYNFSPVYDRESVLDPAIIHYLTVSKPWHRQYPIGRGYGDFRKNIALCKFPKIIVNDLMRMMKGAGYDVMGAQYQKLAC